MAHEPGTMDITTQEKTYDAFITWITRGTVVSIGLLIVVALFNA